MTKAILSSALIGYPQRMQTNTRLDRRLFPAKYWLYDTTKIIIQKEQSTSLSIHHHHKVQLLWKDLCFTEEKSKQSLLPVGRVHVHLKATFAADMYTVEEKSNYVTKNLHFLSHRRCGQIWGVKASTHWPVSFEFLFISFKLPFTMVSSFSSRSIVYILSYLRICIDTMTPCAITLNMHFVSSKTATYTVHRIQMDIFWLFYFFHFIKI